jgi:[ribosomal protein S5]-alanine N-acetyltransferase
MSALPTLHTERLILRPFILDDAPAVKILAGERKIADTTSLIPHPYQLEDAVNWIMTHSDSFEKRREVVFAITLRESGELVGAIGLGIDRHNQLAEMGYWVGVPYWNNGYCTEAARAVLSYAFEKLELNRVEARHMTRNPSSGRIMEKIGMQLEGVLRQQIQRWGVFEDANIFAILREDYEKQKNKEEMNY